MKKDELIAQVSAEAGLTKKATAAVLDALTQVLTSILEKGDAISIRGLGSFKVVERAARPGRNPATGVPVQIPATKVVKFTPGPTLKEKVNK